MVATHYTMGSPTFTSGISREVLRRLTWAQITREKGARLAMIAEDLDRHDIRPEVRLSEAAFKRFRKGATTVELTPELGEVGDYTLTGEWRSVRPDYAVALFYASLEDVTLGAPGMTVEPLDEYGMIKAPPRAHQGTPGLFEFRMPSEALILKDS